MGIEWFRDLVVCIFGLGAALAIILIAVVALLLYLKIRPVLDSLKKTTKTVENISNCVESEVAGPLAQVAAFVQGVYQAIGIAGRFRKGKGETRDE